jgi:hypothetical protein
MKLVWLSWYITAVSALLSLIASAITYAPGMEDVGATISMGFAVATVIGFIASLWIGKRPKDHWVHHSRPLWTCFVVAAATVSLMLVAVG